MMGQSYPIYGLFLGVEDTGHVTIEHCTQTYYFYCFPHVFCPFVSYCFTSTVSSTPSKSQFMPITSIILAVYVTITTITITTVY